jgi:hypothetical protein
MAPDKKKILFFVCRLCMNLVDSPWTVTCFLALNKRFVVAREQ